MIDVLARFDRGPLEEIRVSLIREKRRTSVDVRVYGKPMAGGGDPFPAREGITVPLELFDTLVAALHIVDSTLRKRGVLQRDRITGHIEATDITQMVGGETTVVSTPRPDLEESGVGSWSTKHLGRADVRLALDCSVEYAVRGRQARAQEPERKRGRTKDISPTGAQVVLRERISVLTMLHVTIRLPVGDVSLPCEVVWSQRASPTEIARDGCRHGLRFTAISPREASLLRLLIDHRTGAAGPASE